MKRILFLLIALLASLQIWASDIWAENSDGVYIYYDKLFGTEVAVTYLGSSYDDYSNEYTGNIEIPTTVTHSGVTYTVTSIGSHAFYGCSDLTSVTIPNSVTSIGCDAFCGCSGLTSVTIPDFIISIGEGAFYGCSGLTSVTIPNYVQSIGEVAFYGCSGLISVVIGNSVKSIGYMAFYDCSSLVSVTLPNSVNSIGKYAFKNCNSLSSVVIGNSVTSIKKEVFSNCPALSELTIGASVSEIEESAFAKCPLTDVYTCWNSPAGLNISDNAFTDVYKTTLHVPIGTTENYKYRSPWNNFLEIVEYTPGGNIDEDGDVCEAPEIHIVDNRLSFSCATPDAQFYYKIDCYDNTPLTPTVNGTVSLTGIYEITAYAYAEGYKNSEIVTAFLVWVNPSKDYNPVDVLNIEAAKAVIINARDGNIIVSGTERGECIRLCTIDGQSCIVSADDDFTVIHCPFRTLEPIIVSYGGKTVKLLVKSL